MVSNIYICPNVKTVSFLGLTQYVMIDFSFSYPDGFNSLIFCLGIYIYVHERNYPVIFFTLVAIMSFSPLRIILISYNEFGVGG